MNMKSIGVAADMRRLELTQAMGRNKEHDEKMEERRRNKSGLSSELSR